MYKEVPAGIALDSKLTKLDAEVLLDWDTNHKWGQPVFVFFLSFPIQIHAEYCQLFTKSVQVSV